jgi:Zn-dependent peptidase ImmA (M78 family)
VVNLGFGYKVTVKVLSPAMMKVMGCDGWAGVWMADDNAIYIDKSMSLARKQEAFFHELGHAVNDMSVRAKGGI